MEEVSKKAIKSRFMALAHEIMLKQKMLKERAFAESIGISPNQWSNIKGSEDKYITAEMVATTLRVYSYVNPDWLLTGQGQMFRLEAPTGAGKTEAAAALTIEKIQSLEWAQKLIERLEKENERLWSIIQKAGLGKIRGVLAEAALTDQEKELLVFFLSRDVNSGTPFAHVAQLAVSE